MNYTLGSFNLKQLNIQSNGESKKNFSRLAQMIADEHFDILALQEVVSEDGFKYLARELRPYHYDGICAESRSYFSHGNEMYGFVWNTKRLQLIGSPLIFKRYRIRNSLCEGGLLRPPYYARFTPKGTAGGSNFEIRIINTHILSTKPRASEDDVQNYELRKGELKLLAEEIYTAVADKRYGDNLPAYTFLMGDYNLCLFGYGEQRESIPAVTPLTATRHLLTTQTEKTTLKKPETSNNQGKEVVDYYANNYDHFSYEATLREKLLLKVSKVDALSDYYQNDTEAFQREISDHVPIKLCFNLMPRIGGYYGLYE